MYMDLSNGASRQNTMDMRGSNDSLMSKEDA